MRSFETTRNCQRPGWLVALAASLWAAAAAAQPARFECAQLAASTSRQPPYGRVAGQPRCEGFFEKNVAQPFLELVSLTRSPPGAWTAASDGRLDLRAAPRADARLVIQPMRSNPLYRVDAALPRAATLGWDSGTMLQATGLRLRDLGFLAFVGSETPPVTVAPVSAAASTPSAAEGSPVYAVLRPSVGVSGIAWRAYRTSAGATPAAWQELPGGSLFAWERVVLPVTMPADRHGLRVDVRALDGEGRPLPLLQFAILGVDDESP